MTERSYHLAGTQIKPKTWYQRDKGVRLSQDKERLAEAFPGLSYCIDEQKGYVFL